MIHQNQSWWQKSRAHVAGGPRVLIATSLGGYPHGVTLESALAIALTLRGAQVEILLCDKFLPACQLTKIGGVEPEMLTTHTTQPRCATCYSSGQDAFAPLGLPVYRYSQFVTVEQITATHQIVDRLSSDKVEAYRFQGIAVGEHAMAGTLRYFARGDLENEPLADTILRRYLRAALLSVYAIQGVLNQRQYEVACFHHGIYVPQGLIGEVCRQKKVRVVNWNPAYRKHCFIFSHNDTYHHTMISEPKDVWEYLEWKPELNMRILDYLKSRWSGTQDWIWFHESPQENLAEIATEIGIDFSKPCIGLLTNVMWDARLHYKSNAFPDMLTWVLQTIDYFAKRPDLQLIIRAHPAEVRGATPSRQPIVSEIRRSFPTLPKNVFVIPPESRVSTYAVMEKCNAVLIYNTKTGIELSSMGIPVIVTGEAWIRGKGFSLDATNATDYYQLLDKLPLAQGLTAQELESARKYAFHFFFRRMIPLPFIENESLIDLGSLDDLRPGRFLGLDVICSGILQGTPFIFPAEKEAETTR